MAAPVYATIGQWSASEWAIDPIPANGAAMLSYASRVIRRETLTARYATTETGAPAPGPVADALRDATIAQASYWARTGVDPTLGDLQTSVTKPVAASKSIGSAQISYGTASQQAAATAQQAAARTLCLEARLILDDGGLLGGRPGATR